MNDTLAPLLVLVALVMFWVVPFAVVELGGRKHRERKHRHGRQQLMAKHPDWCPQLLDAWMKPDVELVKCEHMDTPLLTDKATRIANIADDAQRRAQLETFAMEYQECLDPLNSAVGYGPADDDYDPHCGHSYCSHYH